MTYRFIPALLMALSGFFTAPAIAQNASAQNNVSAFSAAEKNIWRARVNQALAGLPDMSGRFEQQAPNGAQAAGSYLIDWPENLRFAYDAGGTSVVTVRGKFVAVQDEAGGQPNWFPVSLTPLAMIRRAVAQGVSEAMMVGLDVQETIYAVTLADPSGDMPGRATLYFTKADNQLYAWRLVDVQNLVTLVRLREIKRLETLDKSLFAIVETYEDDDY